jgi:adenosine kinase
VNTTLNNGKPGTGGAAPTAAARGKALICGSMAYDSIMIFGDRFHKHILPEKIHILNVSFFVPQMRREFGGCAGNIAYNLHLLGDVGLPMATVGKDFAPYAEWMDALGVPRDHIKVIESEHTAQAFIITDLDNNQITAFHPGAMQHSHSNQVGAANGIAVGIVAPDGRDGMIQHAAQFADAKIPFIFDPGQGLPMFGKEDLERFVSQARWVTVNEYEWQMLQQKTGWTVKNVLDQVQALIVTLGERGSAIHTPEGTIEIPCAAPKEVVDPTGCGDAYRAGLLYGLLRGLDWQTTGQIASLMGALKVETRGPQNHRFTREEFRHRFESNFGAPAARRIDL